MKTYFLVLWLLILCAPIGLVRTDEGLTGDDRDAIAIPVMAITLNEAYAAADWKKEFEEVCAATQDAMMLSRERLSELIRRCDQLKPRMETLEETEKKVYLRRLRMCRDLYSFVLDSRNASVTDPASPPAVK